MHMIDSEGLIGHPYALPEVRYLAISFRSQEKVGIRTEITIHNLTCQGSYP